MASCNICNSLFLPPFGAKRTTHLQLEWRLRKQTIHHVYSWLIFVILTQFSPQKHTLCHSIRPLSKVATHPSIRAGSAYN